MSSRIKKNIYSFQHIEELIIHLKRGGEVENASFENGIVKFDSIDFDFRKIGLYDIKTPIIFKNCVFSCNGNLQSLDISYLNFSITFEECEATRITIQNSTIDGDVKFHKNLIGEIKFQNVNIESRVLSISNNETGSKIEINDGSFKEISFRDNQADLELNRTKVSELKIFRNQGEFNINDCVIERGKVNHNKLGSVFKINSTPVAKDLLFDKNHFKTISIESQEVSKLYFTHNSGDLIIGDPRDSSFPDLVKNGFSSIRIVAISDSERSYVVNVGALNLIVLENLAMSDLHLSGDDVSEIIVRDCFESDSEFNLSISNIGSCSIDKIEIQKLTITQSEMNEFHLQNCNINELELIENSFGRFLLIDNIGLTNIRLIEINSEMVDIQDSNIQQFEINQSKITKLHFTQKEKLDLELTQVKNLGSIEFSDARKNESDWFFNNLSISKASFNYCENVENIIINEEIGDDKQLSGFHFHNSNIRHVFCKHLISSIYSKKSIYVDFVVKNYNSTNVITGSFFESVDDSVEKLSLINYSPMKGLHLEDLSVSELLTIESGSHQTSIKIFNSGDDDRPLPFLKNISISSWSSRSTKIENIITDKLELKSCRPYDFLIKESMIRNLILNDFKKQKSNDGSIGIEMSFVNTDRTFRGGILAFKNSNLDDLSLNSCYFDSFEELDIYSSKLDKVYCTATTWPKKVVSYDNEQKLQQFEIREACRQLKLAMGNHQDRVSELQFHALEMKAYQKIVWEGKSWRKSNDIISLLGGLSNNFGANWLKPLGLAIFSISLIYSGMISSHFSTNVLSSEFKYFFNWEDYFQLFNPTHRISQLSMGGTVSGLTAFLDFFSRLVSAFFIYQVATAFRKFRK